MPIFYVCLHIFIILILFHIDVVVLLKEASQNHVRFKLTENFFVKGRDPEAKLVSSIFFHVFSKQKSPILHSSCFVF